MGSNKLVSRLTPLPTAHPEQVEVALLPSTAESESAAKLRPEKELRMLFAHNALGILSHMAAENDEAYFRGSRPCDDDEPPAVTREIISIELEAERGPLVEAHPSPLHPAPASAAAEAAAAAAVARGTRHPAKTTDRGGSQPTSIQVPVPRRQPIHEASLEKSLPRPQQQQLPHGYSPDHGGPQRHSSASRSPATATTPNAEKRGGSTSKNHGGGEDDSEGGGVEAEARVETTRFMQHLCRNAQRYGLVSQPTTSHRPVLSGTVMAREQGFFPASSAIYGEDGRAVVDTGAETGVANGNGGHGDPSASEPGKFPVCTFVLTTLDDHEKAPRSGDDDEEDYADVNAGAAAGNRSLDIVLFVIEGARPMSCRSWNGEGSALTGVSGRDWWTDGPFPEDVALQARQLVERLLRLAIAQRRRDTVWELFDLDNPWSPLKNAAVVSSVTPPQPLPVRSPPPHSWHPPLARGYSASAVPQTVQPPAAAADSSKHLQTPPLRAPSPAFSYTSIGTGYSIGGMDGLQAQDFDGGGVAPHVSELNLRDLLEVSFVTPLGVALPTLGGIIDPRHGVDWGGWFQHLADSSMRTLVFEDGDAVVAPPVDPFGDAFDAISASSEEDEGGTGEGEANPVPGAPARRVLLALPTLAEPVGGLETTGEYGSDGRRGEGEGGGEGPWVGSTRVGAAPRGGQAATLLFCVILHKVG